MKFPFNIKIYVKDGRFLGDARIEKVYAPGMGECINILSNIDEFYGHFEDQSLIGYRYGKLYSFDKEKENWTNKQWIDFMNGASYNYSFKLNNKNIFKEIKI